MDEMEKLLAEAALSAYEPVDADVFGRAVERLVLDDDDRRGQLRRGQENDAVITSEGLVGRVSEVRRRRERRPDHR